MVRIQLLEMNGFDHGHQWLYPAAMRPYRDYRHTVVGRARRNVRFKMGLLESAVAALQTNELLVSKEMLRNYIEATDGLGSIAARCGITSKSLLSMLGPRSDPKARIFFSVLTLLVKDANLTLKLVPSRRSRGLSGQGRVAVRRVTP